MTNDNPVIYREVQKFNQFWVRLLIILPAAIAWYGAIEQLVYGRPYGNNPVSDQGMIAIWVIFGFLFPLFMMSIRLIVEVKGDGIYVKFFPFHLSYRHFPFENISAYSAISYRPILDYGGGA